MLSPSIANIGIATNRRCMLCNNSLVNDNYDAIRGEFVGKLRELAERWESLEKELCKECPYNEFQLVKQRLIGWEIIYLG